MYFAHSGCVSCGAFLNQQYVVTGAYDRHAIVWSISENNSLKKRLDLRGHAGWVTGIDGSRDGNWVITSSNDTTIRLWHLEDAYKSIDVGAKRDGEDA